MDIAPQPLLQADLNEELFARLSVVARDLARMHGQRYADAFLEDVGVRPVMDPDGARRTAPAVSD
jgi:hypothetical protein